jgi:hypothetical protein
MNSGHSRYRNATNRQFQPNEWLEKYIDSWNWLTNEIPGPGGKIIKMKWKIDWWLLVYLWAVLVQIETKSSTQTKSNPKKSDARKIEHTDELQHSPSPFVDGRDSRTNRTW